MVIDKTFEVILQSCDELNVKIKNADNNSYQTEGKSPKFQLRLIDKQSGTFIDVYDFSLLVPDSRFIWPLFKSIARQIPFSEGFSIYPVENFLSSDYDPILYAWAKPIICSIKILDSTNMELLNRANVISVIPKESNNLIEIKKGNDNLLTIPVISIKEVIATSQLKGTLRKHNDSILKITYNVQ